MKTWQTLVMISLLLWSAQAVLARDMPDPGHNPGMAAYMDATAHYEARRFDAAYDQYIEAAGWGNKLAQFNLGTMHYNGIGAARDVARAWAWIELSAERQYPQLRAAAREVWSELDAVEQSRAQRIYQSELLPKYGDEATLPRAKRYVSRRYRAATGSRLGGSGSNTLLVQPSDDIQSVGDVYYDEDGWRVERWLEAEKEWFERMMSQGVPIAEFEEN